MGSGCGDGTVIFSADPVHHSVAVKDTITIAAAHQYIRKLAHFLLVFAVEVGEAATADTADSEDYQAVLLQRGTADSYESFIEDSEADLKQAYGVIKPRKVNLTVEGAAVEAVRCDIRTYYAVLATITYDSGDVVYVSALTKLASISDVVNLVESVSLS